MTSHRPFPIFLSFLLFAISFTASAGGETIEDDMTWIDLVEKVDLSSWFDKLGPNAYWVPPLPEPNAKCTYGTKIRVGDRGEFTCLRPGEAICRDNEVEEEVDKDGNNIDRRKKERRRDKDDKDDGDNDDDSNRANDWEDTSKGKFGFWRFGIDETKNSDGSTTTMVKLWDPKVNVVYSDFEGVTHLCIGELREESKTAYSNERPWMFVYNEKRDEYMATLLCDGAESKRKRQEDKLTQLKMVNNEHIGNYAHYPVTVVKMKKGETEDKEDDNTLWGIKVRKESRDSNVLTSEIEVNHFCKWEVHSEHPSVVPSAIPSFEPSALPSDVPSISSHPSSAPSEQPSDGPTLSPSGLPSQSSEPSATPSSEPSLHPSSNPSEQPSDSPSASLAPSAEPSMHPSQHPSESSAPSAMPSSEPSLRPTSKPSEEPSQEPSQHPSQELSESSNMPSTEPSLAPSVSAAPSDTPSATATDVTSEMPSAEPSLEPPSSTRLRGRI